MLSVTRSKVRYKIKIGLLSIISDYHIKKRRKKVGFRDLVIVGVKDNYLKALIEHY